MEDDNSMSVRILCTLESILRNDPEIGDFCIIPKETNTHNKSPILYEEHNIGLESWCVKHIYHYAYLELFETRRLSKSEKHSLQYYNNKKNLNRLLIAVLLLNPDVTTFWNMKHELVESEELSIEQELQFSRLVLTYKNKSNETFTYRRWLLKRVLEKNNHNNNDFSLLIQRECEVCEMAADKSPNNYHAWNHRIWTIETFLKDDNMSTNTIIETELSFSCSWIKRHVSEHTGFHYRQYVLDLLLRKKSLKIYDNYYDHVVRNLNLFVENDPRNILTFLLGSPRKNIKEIHNNHINVFMALLHDLFEINSLTSFYPNHESLYYHRRFLIFQLIEKSYEYHDLHWRSAFNFELKNNGVNNYQSILNEVGEKQAKIFKSEPDPVENSYLYKLLQRYEASFVKYQNTDGELVKRHERWLKLFLNFSL